MAVLEISHCLPHYPLDPLALCVRQVEEFNEAVTSGAEPVASGWDGLKTAEVTHCHVGVGKDGAASAVGVTS